jgi:hypothetical protein
MGLLDEAIREHLELKRRRGADPSEVAREEQAVFAPEVQDDAAPARAPQQDASGPADAESTGLAEANAPERPEPSESLQETAEIDMRGLLDGDDAYDAEWSMPGREPFAAGVGLHAAEGSDADGEPSAWEVSARRKRRLIARSARDRAVGGELSTEGSLP